MQARVRSWAAKSVRREWPGQQPRHGMAGALYAEPSLANADVVFGTSPEVGRFLIGCRAAGSSISAVRLLSDNCDEGLIGAQVRRRAVEAVAWCQSRASLEDPRQSLRQLPNPLSEFGQLQLTPGRVVHRLVCTRERRLAIPNRDECDLGDGRLLLYFPDADLADGAAEVGTRGYFDVNNTPPWDSWIGLMRIRRLSFRSDRPSSRTSRECRRSRRRGIWANPESCIRWIDKPWRDALGVGSLPTVR